MKKLLLTTILFTFVLNALPQQHLSFMGVTMGGNISTFSSILSTQKDLTIVSSGSHDIGLDGDDWCTLEGDFWKFSNTSILVSSPYRDNGVTRISVGCSGNIQVYNSLISQLDRKYGKHSIVQGHWVYTRVCLWKTKRGNIKVSRTKFYTNNGGRCNIEIEYKDYPLVNRESRTRARRDNIHRNDL